MLDLPRGNTALQVTIRCAAITGAWSRMNTTSPLQLRMQFLRAAESGDPFAFRFEPQDYVLPTEGQFTDCARFAWTPEFLCDLQAVRRPGRDAAVVQRVGETLRRFIQDAGWAAMEQEIDEALAADRNVIVSIRSSAAELYALPWELLTRRSGQFLAKIRASCCASSGRIAIVPPRRSAHVPRAGGSYSHGRPPVAPCRPPNSWRPSSRQVGRDVIPSSGTAMSRPTPRWSASRGC